MKTSGCRIFVCICAVVILLIFYFWDPAEENWWLKCPLYRFFGWQCPFCGSQRALHAFLHGRFVDAWRYNPALWVLAPYGCLFLLGQCSDRWREWASVRWCCRNRVVLGFFLSAVWWGIVRNLWF